MNKLFKIDKAINSLLYALQELGGKSDMHKLCKILYFADQRHLSQYGRSITGDIYIAMKFGPVPSCVNDILKAVRGDSFFSSSKEVIPLKESMSFENHFMIRGLKSPDMDELSVSDVKCLDYAISLCKNKNFAELTQFSHGIAWNNTQLDQAMSVKDILCEIGDDDAYANFIADNLKIQTSFL